MKKIILIEDEEKLRNELKKFLENNAYEVLTLTNFNETLEFIKNNNCDLVLLDINLPNIDGETILKELRKDNNVPVIIVTSRNTEVDEYISISYGADDFIIKPYNTQILLARIENVLKRVNKTDNILKYEDLIIDVSKSSLIHNNEIINLSKNEFKILYYLLINRGKIISRDDLMNYLWDNDEFVDDNTLTVNISRIKNKLKSAGYDNIIVTKRNQGYIIL